MWTPLEPHRSSRSHRRPKPWWLLAILLGIATPLRNGRILIAGGSDGRNALASLEIYDPATRTFSSAPGTMLVPRESHTATSLANGRVLIAGGSNASGALDAAELYDPAGGTLTAAGPLTAPRT